MNTRYNVSLSHGMSEDTAARVVPISKDRASVTGFVHRSIVANPGCLLLFPDRKGAYRYDEACQRCDLTAPLLHLLTKKNCQIIEYRSCPFYIDLPIMFDAGYDYRARCENRVSYTAHFAVSIRDLGSFLRSFELSASRPAITTEIIQRTLARSTITLLGNEVTETGHIRPRRFYSLFSAFGLFVHGMPVITDYHNSRAKRLGELEDDFESAVRNAISEVKEAQQAITRGVQETLPKLLASLAGSGLEPAEMSYILDRFNKEVAESRKAVLEVAEYTLKSQKALLANAQRRIAYRDDDRPARVYQKAAQQLAQKRTKYLAGEHGQDRRPDRCTQQKQHKQHKH